MTFDRALGSAMLAAEEMGYKVDPQEFFSKKKDRRYVLVRMVICYLLRNHSHYSTVAIGGMLGRDHASAIYLDRQARSLMMTDPVIGNLISRSCRLAGVEVPDGLCLKEPCIYRLSPGEAKKAHPGAVRVDKEAWRLLRPWLGETADTITPWGHKRPVEQKRRIVEEGGYVVPLQWSRKEKRKLDQWREQTRGSVGVHSPSTVGFGGSGRRGAKTPKSHRL